MIRRKHNRRQGIAAFAVIAFTAGGLAFPIIFSEGSSDGNLPGNAVVAAIRNQYALSGPVRLLSTPLLTVESGTISVASAQAAKARTGEAMTALLATGSARLVLDGAVIRVDVPSAEPGATAEGGFGPIVSAFLRLAFEGLSVRHSRVVMRLREGRDLVFTDVDAEISLQKKSVAAKGSFEHRGQRLTFDTLLGAIERKSGAQVPLKASVKGSLVETQIDGTLVLGDSLQLSGAHAVLTTPDIRRAANWLGAGWPAGPGLGYFRAEGQVDWADRVIAFQKADFSIDGNQATGMLTFGFDGPRPSVEGTLALSSLDLTRYLQVDEASVTSREAMLGPIAAWLAAPTSFSSPLLPLIDADLRISSAKTIAGPVRLGRSATTLSLKSGRLLADVAELEIDSGTNGLGQLSVDMSGAEPRFTIRGKLSGLKTGDLVTGLTGSELIRGRGDVVIDVAARGDTGGRILDTLSGKAALSMAQGGKVGIDIRRLLEASEPEPVWLWNGDGQGETSVGQLDAHVQIRNGMLKAEKVNVVVGNQLVSATGQLELASGTLNIAVSRSDAPPADAPEGNPVAAVAPATKVVELHGPWRHPAMIPASARRTAASGGETAADHAVGDP